MDRLVGCATLVKESAEEAMVQRLWGICDDAAEKPEPADGEKVFQVMSLSKFHGGMGTGV